MSRTPTAYDNMLSGEMRKWYHPTEDGPHNMTVVPPLLLHDLETDAADDGRDNTTTGGVSFVWWPSLPSNQETHGCSTAERRNQQTTQMTRNSTDSTELFPFMHTGYPCHPQLHELYPPYSSAHWISDHRSSDVGRTGKLCCCKTSSQLPEGC